MSARNAPFGILAIPILWMCSTLISMTSHYLLNYLRSNRKRLALTQDDVAFLLGIQSGAKVCRHETFVCEPSLATALAYEVISQRPARELFAGLFKKIEREVAQRAKVLTYKVEGKKVGRRGTRRRKTIVGLASLASKRPCNETSS